MFKLLKSDKSTWFQLFSERIGSNPWSNSRYTNLWHYWFWNLEEMVLKHLASEPQVYAWCEDAPP